MARRKQPHIPDQLLDQLLAGTDAKAASTSRWRRILRGDSGERE